MYNIYYHSAGNRSHLEESFETLSEAQDYINSAAASYCFDSDATFIETAEVLEAERRFWAEEGEDETFSQQKLSVLEDAQAPCIIHGSEVINCKGGFNFDVHYYEIVEE